MKDIFDKIAQNAKDISQGIVGQTKTTVSQGKVEIDLLQAKRDLKKLYTKLGKKVYENRLYQAAELEVDILYQKITDQDRLVKELERSAREIRNEQKNTFESVKRDVKKTWDGEGQETKTPEPDEDGYLQMKFCKNCNVGNHPDAHYCIACGSKQS